MPDAPSWSETLLQISAFTSLDLVHGLLVFAFALTGGVLFVGLLFWALGSRK
jgi:hypothetical protein